MAKSKRDPFVTIRTVSGPIEAEMLRDLLDQEGIEATTPGAGTASLLGAAGNSLLSGPLQVRESQAEEARQILDAMENFDAVVDDDGNPIATAEDEALHQARIDRLTEGETEGEGPYRNAPVGEERITTPRLGRVAVFAALVPGFGSGHFYARDNHRGLLLLVTQVMAIAIGMSGDPRWFIGLLMSVGADVFSAPLACRKTNGERPSGVLTQIRAQLPLTAAVLSVVFVLAPWSYRQVKPVEYLKSDIPVLCERLVTCGTTGSVDLDSCVSGVSRDAALSTSLNVAIEECAECVDDVGCSLLERRCAHACPYLLTTPSR